MDLSQPAPSPAPAPLPPAVSLRSIVASRDLILVTGKGGTGKSSVVAAIAEVAARVRGSAVAIEMSAHPRLPEMLGPGSKVIARNLDAEQAVYPSLGRLLHLPELAARMLGNRILRMFIRTSPAVREMIVLDELAHQVDTHAPAGRPVIVDLPASGHALSFLDTPRAVQRTLRIGPLAGVAAHVADLILDGRRCQLVLVALPEELPVNETIEIVRKAREIGLKSRTLIVNQVPPHPVEHEDRHLLDLLEQGGDAALGRYADVARAELDGADQARAQVDRLRQALGEPVIELPRSQEPDAAGRVAHLVEVLLS